MSKGIYATQNGRVFKLTTPDAKKVLKAVVKGQGATLTPEKEIGPFIDLDTISPEQAERKFLEIEMA